MRGASLAAKSALYWALHSSTVMALADVPNKQIAATIPRRRITMQISYFAKRQCACYSALVSATANPRWLRNLLPYVDAARVEQCCGFNNRASSLGRDL
jgi:hypothetical protein